ncbi:ABC-type nitrate/sulfonate/bicarbonate transport systems periplasmic component [Gaiella occulta]|uniref:Thiamine pyrimidine synthase n=1 Tax=Gaiella occulta TaxID=1002870 RepID=A0A7M2YXC7_9ACTN|nr:ABC transporter substrate-binding protein [Gaiella occulta]RDI74128.1 ABC-type nitrate/sulfonate/bicarbonate transport systems periplasmic component [Gaiella occulta]
MRSRWSIGAALAVMAVAALTFVSLGSAKPASAKVDKVTLQLKWVAQAQFAGYYAAAAKGYYKQFGLDVTIKPGGPDITPEQVVASGQAEFGIDWLPSLLATRDKGGDIVNIAQVFRRSGMTELTWKDSGITTVAQMKGKKVGVWCCGNENELFAALVKNGLNPKKASDVKIINQPFDMNLFLQRKVDAAAAMTYNELAQVLETKNPKTGKLYTLADLNVITMEKAGTAMLEDGIFATGDWLKDPNNVDIAKRFVAASLKGWAYCRDNLAACTAIVLKNGTLLGKGHQTWQMNEINKLVWPSPGGVGVMDPAAFTRTAKIAQQFKVITKAPQGAYRTDIAKGALALLKKQGVNVVGAGYKPAVVKVTPGGK